MAAVGGCGGLPASICGSSLATAATMAPVALPELQPPHTTPTPYRYRRAGRRCGTLGILDPALGRAWSSTPSPSRPTSSRCSRPRLFRASSRRSATSSPSRSTCASAPRRARSGHACGSRATAAARSPKPGPSFSIFAVGHRRHLLRRLHTHQKGAAVGAFGTFLIAVWQWRLAPSGLHRMRGGRRGLNCDDLSYPARGRFLSACSSPCRACRPIWSRSSLR